MEHSTKNFLHLGCGRTILQGWINLDIAPLPGVDVVADLDACRTNPLPFHENSIDEILCVHTIEHLKNTLDFMQELHRIAKPNVRAIFSVPYGSNDAAFEDPTHVRQYFLNSFEYFGQPCYWRADYGYRGDWQTETIELLVEDKFQNKQAEEIFHEIMHLRNTVIEMTVVLRAIKPIRPPERNFQNAPKIMVVPRKSMEGKILTRTGMTV